MSVPSSLAQYAALLKIREAAARRDSILVGSLFLIVILLTFGAGLVFGLSGREAYITSFVDLGLAISFVVIWVRWEILKEMVQLIEKM